MMTADAERKQSFKSVRGWRRAPGERVVLRLGVALRGDATVSDDSASIVVA